MQKRHPTHAARVHRIAGDAKCHPTKVPSIAATESWTSCPPFGLLFCGRRALASPETPDAKTFTQTGTDEKNPRKDSAGISLRPLARAAFPSTPGKEATPFRRTCLPCAGSERFTRASGRAYLVAKNRDLDCRPPGRTRRGRVCRGAVPARAAGRVSHDPGKSLGAGVLGDQRRLGRSAAFIRM